MAKIIIQNLYQKQINYHPTGKNVLKILHESNVDWLHSCGGKGRCTTCKMIVISGLDILNPDSAAENNYRKMGLLSAGERLACQTSPSGDLVILVPMESRLPHLKYS